MSAHEMVTGPGDGLLQGKPQRKVDHISEDTQMPDAPPAPLTPENSDSMSRVGKKQAEDAAHAASEKPKVPPKEPIQAKNPRRPPKLPSKTARTADQEGPKITAENRLQQQLDEERARGRGLSAEATLHKNAKETLQGKVTSFQQLDEQRARSRDLSTEAALHKNAKETLQGKVTSLQQQLANEQYHNSQGRKRENQLSLEIHNSENNRRELESQRRELESRLLAAQNTHKNLSVGLDDAKDQIRDLQRRLQGQEASVTKAQAAAVTLLSSTVSSTLPDDVIRGKFLELYDTLQDWARDYATKAFDLANLDSFHKKLMKRKVLGDAKGVPKSLTFDLEDDTAPATLLNASVTLETCRAFFTNPFFCASLDTPNQQNRSDVHEENICNVLDSIWRTFSEANEAEAHSWRAYTVQMFCESTLHQTNFERYCKKTVEEFCERYDELLDRSLIENARKSLWDPVARFGELALQLWSTKIDIQFCHLGDYGNTPFALASEEMQAARVVRLDEYDTALDGRPIQVVVQPMIAAFGTPDGKEYQKKKIWAKAGVWISNKDRPDPVMIMRRSSMRVAEKSSNSLGARIQGIFR